MLCNNLRMDSPVVASESPDALSGRISWLPVILASVFGLVISSAAGTHIVLVGVMVPIVVAIAWSSPRSLLILLVVWTTELGLMRRLTPAGGKVGFSGDPLLIIGPIMIICLVLIAGTRYGAFANRTRLATVVLVFNILAIVEVINPRQGTLMTGLGGLLFMLVPVSAFWVGRSFVDDSLMKQVIWTIAILGAITAAYGFFQQINGFPSWDQTYIHSKSYSALQVGTTVRPFGTMSSGQEYAGFLCLGLVAWISLLKEKSRLPRVIHLAMIALMGTAIFYESERTAAFLAILAVAVMAGAWRKMPPLTLAIVSVLAVFALSFGLGALLGAQGSGNGVGAGSQQLAQHQLSGLVDPTGKNSSLSGHLRSNEKAVIQGLTDPSGRGVGSVTLAASKYSANTGAEFTYGTEYDPGNMALAFGLPGVVLYFLIVFFGMSTAYRTAMARHDVIGLFVIGVLAATLLNWFNGDLYSVTWLIWLSMGVADGFVSRVARGEIVEPTVTAVLAEGHMVDEPIPVPTKKPRRWIEPS